MTLLLGQTSSGATGDWCSSGEGAAFKFTAVATGTSVTARIQTGIANGDETQMEIGVYNDGGTRPSTKIASATWANPTGSGEIQIPLVVSITSGIAYWIAYTHTFTATFDWNGAASGSYRWYNMSGVLPASWSASDNAGSTGGPILYLDGDVGEPETDAPEKLIVTHAGIRA